MVLGRSKTSILAELSACAVAGRDDCFPGLAVVASLAKSLPDFARYLVDFPLLGYIRQERAGLAQADIHLPLMEEQAASWLRGATGLFLGQRIDRPLWHHDAEHFAYLRANSAGILLAGGLREGAEVSFSGVFWDFESTELGAHECQMSIPASMSCIIF